MTMKYANGTSLTLHPFACGFSQARALCSDGIIRSVRFANGGMSDTFFSIPGRVSVKGKTVSGYVTVETVQGFSTPTDGDPVIVKFVANRYGRNYALLANEGG
jgi:hypothetical protein